MSLIDQEVLKQHQEKRDERRAQASRKFRLFLVGSFFIVSLFYLLGRVFYIKTVHGKEYERAAMALQYSQRNVETAIKPNRGSIVDRNNQSLAISHTVYKIILDIRNLVEESTEIQANTIKNLNLHLGIPETELRNLLRKDPATGKPIEDKHYHVLAENVPRKTKTELLESEVKWVYDEEDTSRSYVHGTLASEVIGFIRGGSKSGLEKFYDTEMAGEEGRMFRYYDSKNNPVTEQKAPKEGYTLVTTLDTNIQKFAEEAAVEAGREYEAQYASVLVMNPMTGEVLAMAQYPSFNLNKPDDKSYFTNAGMPILNWTDDGQVIEQTELSPEDELKELYKAWNNYNVTSTFEPGSIYKPIVVAAALEEGVIGRNHEFFCEGKRMVIDTEIPCWINAYGGTHGQQTLTQVLANSCNMGMLDIGEALGRDLFHKYQHDFGYGELTGIDLPAEESCVNLLYSIAGLNPVEIATGSIGQGFNNTAIQAVNAFSAVINGGNLMKPYVVSQVMDKSGNVIKENRPTVVRKVISRDTSNFMRQAMQAVVTPDGTGSRAVIEGYEIGGKTGTAQQGKRESGAHVLTFMAYLPVQDPSIIAMALIDRPREYNEGSTSSAPMLQKVLKKIVSYKAIQPTVEGTSAQNSGLVDKNFQIDDYTGQKVAELVTKLNQSGIDFDCIGNGDIVTSQTPLPGSLGDKDTWICLYLGESEENLALSILPDVRNASIDAATQILEKSGFTVTTETLPPIDAQEQPVITSAAAVTMNEAVKVVYEQLPSGGIKLPQGTQIRLKVR